MKATTQEWLDFARTDLRSCQNNLNDDFVTNIVAFHSQQTVEKALKALLEEKEIQVPRVHNLKRLNSLVKQFIAKPIDLLELDMLDSIYTSSRYPTDIGIISTGKSTLQEANEFYNIATKIFDIILKTIEN